MKLTYFNKLPPQESHLNAIRQSFKRSTSLSLSQLQKSTKLTQTQTRCALEHLLSVGVVVHDKEKNTYHMSESVGDSI